MGVILGSARVSRAGDGVLAIANFSYAFDQTTQKQREVRFGATPKLAARRRRYLIIDSECSVLAAESGAASVSCGVSELEWAWVSVSDCLKRWLWQLASDSLLLSESQLAWQSELESRLQLPWE